VCLLNCLLEILNPDCQCIWSQVYNCNNSSKNQVTNMFENDGPNRRSTEFQWWYCNGLFRTGIIIILIREGLEWMGRFDKKRSTKVVLFHGIVRQPKQLWNYQKVFQFNRCLLLLNALIKRTRGFFMLFFFSCSIKLRIRIIAYHKW
jgi:hypothetical protein